MPTINQPAPPIQPAEQPVAPAELAQRAAEVRRLRAEREAVHPGLVLALSVGCPEHNVAAGELCYAPVVGGVCGQRYERAVQVAKSHRAQRRSQEARR